MSWKVKLAVVWLGLMAVAVMAVLVYVTVMAPWVMAAVAGTIVVWFCTVAAGRVMDEWKRGKGCPGNQ